MLELMGNFLLFALVFGMSATVDTECMKQQVKNKKAIMLGIFCQFVLLPFLGFAIVNLMELDANIGITLLVVTSSPGGSYSNWWVKQKENEPDRMNIVFCLQCFSYPNFIFLLFSSVK